MERVDMFVLFLILMWLLWVNLHLVWCWLCLWYIALYSWVLMGAASYLEPDTLVFQILQIPIPLLWCLLGFLGCIVDVPKGAEYPAVLRFAFGPVVSFCDVLMLQKKLLWWEVDALLLLDLLCFRNFYFLFIIMLGAVVKVGSPGLWQLEVHSSRLFCCLSFLVRNQLYSDGFSFVCDFFFNFYSVPCLCSVYLVF